MATSGRGASFASCSSSERAGDAAHRRRAPGRGEGAARVRPAPAMILLKDWPLFVVLVCGLVVVGMMVLFKLM